MVKQFVIRDLPEGVRAIDFGIRGFDLTYALIEGADVTILVDACPLGGKPGDLYIVEPEQSSTETQLEPVALDAQR